MVDRARGHMNPFRFRSDIVQYIENKTISVMSHCRIRGVVSHTIPSSTCETVHVWVWVVEVSWFRRQWSPLLHITASQTASNEPRIIQCHESYQTMNNIDHKSVLPRRYLLLEFLPTLFAHDPLASSDARPHAPQTLPLPAQKEYQ